MFRVRLIAFVSDPWFEIKFRVRLGIILPARLKLENSDQSALMKSHLYSLNDSLHFGRFLLFF